MGQYFVQPLQWPIEMNFNPAWSAGHILPVILCPPAFHKAHSYGAHLCEFIDCLESMVYRLRQKSCKFLVVENFETTSRRYFADCGWMEAMTVVAVATLYKDAAVAQAFCIYFTAYIIQMHTCRQKSEMNQKV